MPAFANAHDHARPLSLTSFGCAFLPLETWLPKSALATPPDPYLAAAASFGRAARAGCAAVMVHYTRPSGTKPLVEEAKEIARAARDVGIRMTFALAVRDRNPLVYGGSEDILAKLPSDARDVIASTFLKPGPSPADYIALTEEIAAAIEGPLVQVQFGPAGVQWCSQALLEAVAERSASTGRRVHMHLLETVYQAVWAERHFPQGVVAHLKDIGLLSSRLTLAHAIYADDAARAMMAEAGATIVNCIGSNLNIRSGVPQTRAARKAGCRVAVGVDGLAFDEDDDILRETRLLHALQSPAGYAGEEDRRRFLMASIADGRASLSVAGTGALREGEPADLIVLDLEALDRDALVPIDPVDLLFARGSTQYLRDVVVAGRTIVRDGQVVGIDLPAVEHELRARYRAALDGSRLLATMPTYEAALRDWYLQFVGCG